MVGRIGLLGLRQKSFLGLGLLRLRFVRVAGEGFAEVTFITFCHLRKCLSLVVTFP